MKSSQPNFTAIPDMGQVIGFCKFLPVSLKNSNLLVSNDLCTIDFTGVRLYLRWISRKITVVSMLKLLFLTLKALFGPRTNLIVENVSIRQQLIIYQRSAKKPKIKRHANA